jgi:hypothetical protein
MTWWAFTLTLEDGQALDRQAGGKTPTETMRASVDRWLDSFGAAAKFHDSELAIVEYLGPLTGEFTSSKGAPSKRMALGLDSRNEVRKAEGQ